MAATIIACFLYSWTNGMDAESVELYLMEDGTAAYATYEQPDDSPSSHYQATGTYEWFGDTLKVFPDQERAYEMGFDPDAQEPAFNPCDFCPDLVFLKTENGLVDLQGTAIYRTERGPLVLETCEEGTY